MLGLQLSDAVRAVVVAALLMLLTGCGFRLAGLVSLPAHWQPVYLDVHPAGKEFAHALAEVLARQDVALTETASEAAVLVRIQGETVQRRALSLDPGGKANEYQVTYQVVYEVRAANGDTIAAEQSYQSVRSYAFDARQTLGYERQQAIMLTAMRKQLAQELLARLQHKAAETGK